MTFLPSDPSVVHSAAVGTQIAGVTVATSDGSAFSGPRFASVGAMATRFSLDGGHSAWPQVPFSKGKMDAPTTAIIDAAK